MFVLLLSLFLITACQTRTIYVNQSISSSEPADGSAKAPFQSLSLAFKAINSSTEIVLLGESYMHETAISYQNALQETPMVISIRAENSFVFKFKQDGQVSCSMTDMNKIPRIDIVNLTIQTEGRINSLSLFKGSCDLSFQNVSIDQLSVCLIDNFIASKINVKFSNFTMTNIASDLFCNSPGYGPGKNYYLDSAVLKAKPGDRYSIGIGCELFVCNNCVFENIKIALNGGTANTTIKNSKFQNGSISIEKIQTIIMLENSSFVNYWFEGKAPFSWTALQVTINRCQFSNNTASSFLIANYRGGSVNLDLLIQDSKFYGNKADSGAGISLSYLSIATGTIRNSEFKSNIVTGNGGAISFHAKADVINMLQLSFENNIFESNSATTGGAINANSQIEYELTLQNNSYVNNTAVSGAVFSVQESSFGGGTINFVDSRCSGNRATSGGGILYLGSSITTFTFIFENNLFERNSAWNGGVYDLVRLNQLQMILRNNTYIQNNAVYGTVMYIQASQGEGTIYISDSDFNSNTANETGGVINIATGQIEIDLNFENNTFGLNAALNGGVFNFEPITRLKVALKNQTFDKNTATFGAVISTQGLVSMASSSSSTFDLDVSITKSNFSNNQASTSGGVLDLSSLYGAKISITDSEFRSNSAITEGGGVLYFEAARLGTIVTFQNNIFEANSAYTGGVLNFVSLDQAQIILQNNSYTNNLATIGGTVSFQSFRNIKPNTNLSVLIADSQFRNNQASNSGGSMTFSELEGGNITVINSEFSTNLASSGGGGAIYASQGRSGLIMNFKNNLFSSNLAYMGGAFKLEYMSQTQLNMENNSYINNSATFGGGVGYVLESQIEIKDIDSRLKRNLANYEGGTWSVKGKVSTLDFQNLTFEDNSVRLRGGCIYYATNSYLKLNKVTFKNCSTSERRGSGGALYITANSILEAVGLDFINNQAEFGGSILFQSTQEDKNHTLTDTNFKFDFSALETLTPIQNQVQSEKGGLTLKNIAIFNLNTPFLSHTEGILQIEDLNIDGMKCQSDDGSLTFCLFSLDKQKSTKNTLFTVRRLTAQNFVSNLPLMIATKSSLTLESIMISNVQSTAKTSVALFEQSQINITGIKLFNMTSNFIQATTATILNISNGSFDNQAKRDDISSTLPTVFLSASQSSILIESTDFKFNSPTFSENGGAIMVSNPTGITLINVSFSENKANNGGALFIKGSLTNAQITNCSFSNNLASKDASNGPKFGGAIYVESSSLASSSSRVIQQDQSKATFIIENSVFTENSAYIGGAIYVKETSLILQNNIFDANQATSGGALAIDIEDPTLSIDILQSKCENNIASLYGASILQLRRNAIQDQSGTIFLNETQQFGRGVPAKLRLKTFLYDTATQYLINSLNTTELEKRGHITLEYDSFYDKNITIQNIKGGSKLNRLVEISVWDDKNNHLTELIGGEDQVSLKIINASYPVNSINNVSSVIGVTDKIIQNGLVTFFEETNFFAFPGTILGIQVSTRITHQNLGNYKYILYETFQIQLRDCDVGEIFIPETLICDSCKPNYFSLTNPFSTITCQKCDTNKADCPGWSIIYPKPGYWRISPQSDNILKCSFSQACLGGIVNGTNGEVFSLTGLCNEIGGYEGNLCATCKPGFAKFGSKDQCTNCKENTTYYLRLFGLLIVQIAIMIFNIYSNLRDRDTEEAKKEEVLTLVQGTVTKVIVDYMQILGMVSSIEVNWPGVVSTYYFFHLRRNKLENFGSIVSKGTPSSKDIFTVDCFFSLTQGSNENVFFYKILILNLQPFVFFVAGFLFWIILTKIIKKQRLRHNFGFKNNLLVTTCLIAYLLQAEIIKSTLQLFKCKNLGSLSEEQNFLEEDLQIKCGASTHLAWALGLGLPVLIFWLAFPALILMRVWWKVEYFNKNKTILEKYHFVFGRYQESKIHWDLVIFLRKSAISFVLVFLDNLYAQIFVSLGVILLSLHLNHQQRPYKQNFDVNNLPKINFDLNDIETLSLISNSLLLFGGLYFVQDSEIGVVHVFLIVIIFFVNLLFFLVAIRAFYWVFSIKMKDLLKSKKKILTLGQSQIESKVSKVNAPDEESKVLITAKEENQKPKIEEKPSSPISDGIENITSTRR